MVSLPLCRSKRHLYIYLEREVVKQKHIKRYDDELIWYEIRGCCLLAVQLYCIYELLVRLRPILASLCVYEANFSAERQYTRTLYSLHFNIYKANMNIPMSTRYEKYNIRIATEY